MDLLLIITFMLVEYTWSYLLFWAILAIVANRLYQVTKNVYLQRKWKTGKPKVYPVGFGGIGFLKKFIQLRNSGYFQDFLKKQFEDLNTDTFTQRVLGQNVIFTRSPQNIKAALATQFDDFTIGPRSGAFRPLLGNGVFAADGHQWKVSRQMLRPQFHREQVGHVKALEPHLQALALLVRRYNGQPFDIQPMMSDLTMDASTEFLLGESVFFLRDRLLEFPEEKFPGEEKQHREGHTIPLSDADSDFGKDRKLFDSSLKSLLDYLSFRVTSFNYYWLFDSFKFRKYVRTVQGFAMRFVQKALALSADELEKKKRNSYTIIYELVKVTRDPIIVRDQMLNVMLAGRSTTASLLTSTIFELSRHPEVWQRLREEVISSFGAGTSPEDLDKITFESLKRCTYLKWVINETLRLYPPVSGNFRMASVETTLPVGGGKDGNQPVLVNKGQIVLFHIYTLHRLREFYGNDAETFRPERWEGLSKIGWAFMPFGSGPRVCLGQQFALTEASYVIARLAQMFPKLASFSHQYPPRKTTNATMQVMDGVYVSFE